MTECKRHPDHFIDETGRCSMCRIVERLNEVWAMTMPRMPRYRYWQIAVKGKSRRTFEYTTETADGGRYWAIERRWVKVKGCAEGKIVRKAGFKLRKKAKERAYQWYEKARTPAPTPA